MDYNQKHRGDVYATHGMGPACQVLNITVVTVPNFSINGYESSSMVRLILKANRRRSEDFQNGDQTSTLIRTENGKRLY